MRVLALLTFLLVLLAGCASRPEDDMDAERIQSAKERVRQAESQAPIGPR
jgi:hypothetical protein